MAQSKDHTKFRARKTNDHLTQLSKTLSWILRHGSVQVGLPLQTGGFLFLSDLMKLPQLKRFTIDEVEVVVNDVDRKKRFFLTTDSENGQLKIRANQGHSVQVEDLDLAPITDSTQYPTVVHGTNMEAWQLISTQGLKVMKRIHIHFAIGEPGVEGVISGMRSTATVMVYLDLKKALNEGIQFFKSANNVILSTGLNGRIPPSCFSKVIKRKTGEELIFNNSGSTDEKKITEAVLVSAEEIADDIERTKRKKHFNK